MAAKKSRKELPTSPEKRAEAFADTGGGQGYNPIARGLTSFSMRTEREAYWLGLYHGYLRGSEDAAAAAPKP